MKSIDALKSEHRDLESMLVVLDDSATRLKGGGTVGGDLLLAAVAFFETFGSNCHHAKEEVLFPFLAEHYGLGPEMSFIRALQAQHEVDRAYLIEIKEGAAQLATRDPAARQRLAAVLQEYVQLVKEHIRIEESYFDNLIAATITPADDTRLVERFHALDRQWGDRSSLRAHV